MQRGLRVITLQEAIEKSPIFLIFHKKFYTRKRIRVLQFKPFFPDYLRSLNKKRGNYLTA